jgi:hypothetical protein
MHICKHTFVYSLIGGVPGNGGGGRGSQTNGGRGGGGGGPRKNLVPISSFFEPQKTPRS